MTASSGTDEWSISDCSVESLDGGVVSPETSNEAPGARSEGC